MDSTSNANGTVSDGIDNDPLPSLPPIPSAKSYSPATQAIHADDHLNIIEDVAPPLHVATTFRYASNPDHLKPSTEADDETLSDTHIYSRITAPSTTRLEALLSTLLHAPSLTYSSGLAALHAAYTLLTPRHVSIGNGYHGSHGVLSLHAKLSGTKTLPLDCSPEDLSPGDVIHLETPLNPTGEAYDIAFFARKAHSRGAWLLVDATFGPPGLQDPFLQGADLVMHSGTKYIGGHSDMLCGVLATGRGEWWETLRRERAWLGSVMGSMEGWLGVRSLRTLELRVKRQSENAERLVGWLSGVLRKENEEKEKETDMKTEKEKESESETDTIPEKDKQLKPEKDPQPSSPSPSPSSSNTIILRTISHIQHASLQAPTSPWLPLQMPGGYGPVFALTLKTARMARRLPSKLSLFHHATSLGGVESLIEWRVMSDRTVDPRLMRVSVGVERWEDLKEDLLGGCKALVEEEGEDGERGLS